MPETTFAPKPVPKIGQQVRVTALPAYVKTAESRPMLRPPSAITISEVGIVLARQPGNTWSIRLATGAYLLDRDYFEIVEAEQGTSEISAGSLG